MTRPDWERLYGIAVTQEGHFTTRQAAEAGYSSQLLLKHVRAGRMVRVRRGVYRLVHHPAGDREDLVTVWLWCDRAGVFSHETALSLHGISDVLPAQVHLTLPTEWRRRQLTVPDGVNLYFALVPESDRGWFGAVPVTTVRRTLMDCLAADVPGDTIRSALHDVARRGLLTTTEVRSVTRALSNREVPR